MNTVRVNKNELIQKLKENREIHIREFKETFAEYQKDTIKDIQKMLRVAKKAGPDEVLSTYVNNSAPRSEEKTYDVVIGMLEFSVDTEFDITEKQYKEYVLNEWSWTEQFEFSKTMYLKG